MFRMTNLLHSLSFLSNLKLYFDFISLWLSQIYSLLKRLSEDAAFNFASENSIDIVSVITSTVSGPFLTSYIPSSIRVFTAPITGKTFLHIFFQLHMQTIENT